MTPDEIAKMIPDEVVRRLRFAVLFSSLSITEEETRAAIAAMLSAWPGVESETGTSAYNPLVKRHRLILPLPKEKSE